LVHQKIGRWFAKILVVGSLKFWSLVRRQHWSGYFTKILVVGSPKNWSLVRQNFGRWFAKILVVGSPATLVRIFYQNFGPDILPKIWSDY